MTHKVTNHQDTPLIVTETSGLIRLIMPKTTRWVEAIKTVEWGREVHASKELFMHNYEVELWRDCYNGFVVYGRLRDARASIYDGVDVWRLDRCIEADRAWRAMGGPYRESCSLRKVRGLPSV